MNVNTSGDKHGQDERKERINKAKEEAMLALPARFRGRSYNQLPEGLKRRARALKHLEDMAAQLPLLPNQQN